MKPKRRAIAAHEFGKKYALSLSNITYDETINLVNSQLNAHSNKPPFFISNSEMLSGPSEDIWKISLADGSKISLVFDHSEDEFMLISLEGHLLDFLQHFDVFLATRSP